MRIIEDDLRGPEIAALLQVHLDSMHEHSPPESVHALDLDALRQPEITFFTAWDDDDDDNHRAGPRLMGCGALKTLDERHGEIKSMRTDVAYLRRGVAAAILTEIIDTARARGMTRLSLETGSTPAFDPARRLYERFGFVACGPFGTYWDDPFSRFYTLELDGEMQEPERLLREPDRPMRGN